jgi:hypothetical protein
LTLDGLFIWTRWRCAQTHSCTCPDENAVFTHNETKRAEYEKIIEEGLVEAAVTDMVRVASEMLPNLEAAKKRAGLRLNMPPDAPGLGLILDDGSGCIDTITGIVHSNMSACMVVEESESEVERVRKEILAAIGNAMERVSTVVSDEREKRAKRTSDNRRDGWSAR